MIIRNLFATYELSWLFILFYLLLNSRIVVNEFPGDIDCLYFLVKYPSLSCKSYLQVKKHIKAGEGHEGGIFTVEAPLHASNVQVLDPVTGYG